MNSPLAIQSAIQSSSHNGALVRLVLSDLTETAIYLNDGSPQGELHDMLNAWLAEGNEIALAEA